MSKVSTKLIREIVGVTLAMIGSVVLFINVERPLAILGLVLLIVGIYLAMKETIEES
jgi:uncharacterized membrane protein